MRKNTINSANVHKKISIDKSGKVDYLGAIDSALNQTYNKLDVKYSIKKQNNTLIVDLLYNKKKQYILDNIIIDFENNGLSISVISEDRENNYAMIDLSKKYEYKNIRKILEKADYICK